MKISFRVAGLVIICLCAASLEAFLKPQDYEAVLVPFHGYFPGATADISWRADVWIRNESDEAIEVFPIGNWTPYAGGLFSAIPARTTLFYETDVVEIRTRPMELFQTNAPPGAFLWVKKGAVPSLELSGAIFAVDPYYESPRTTPVTFPIVPLSRFRKGPANILGIWAEADNRYMVRIYGNPETKVHRKFRVNVYSGDQSSALLMTDVLELADYKTSGKPPCFFGDCDLPDLPLKPPYAQRFGMPAPPESGEAQRVRVEFIPEDPTMPYWACVSATDNQTNDVTIYTTGN